MEEKYIRFYMSFYKAFQGKKSYSLFKTNQSQSNDFYQKRYSALDGALGS